MASLGSLMLSSSSSCSCSSSRGLTQGTARPVSNAAHAPPGACPPALRRHTLAGATAVKAASIQGSSGRGPNARHTGTLLHSQSSATPARRRLGLGHSEFLSGAGPPFWDSLRATTETGTSTSSSRGHDRCASGAPRAALRGPGSGGSIGGGDESTPGTSLEGAVGGVGSPGARLAAAAALRGQSSGGTSEEYHSPAGAGPPTAGGGGGLGSPGARLSAAAAASSSSGGGAGRTAAAVAASEAATASPRGGGGGGGSHSRNPVNGGWGGRNAGGMPTTITATASGAAGAPASAGSSEQRGGVVSPTVERGNGAASGPVNGASNGASHSNGAGNGGIRKAGGGPQMPTGGGDGEEEEDEEEDEEEEGGEGSIVANAIEALKSSKAGGAPPGGKEGGGSGVTLGNLINMVKDAEQNILLLNRVRSKALNELSQARLENTNLQNQLRVFQARIAESDARLSMVAQARQRSSILEEQLQGLQERMDETKQVTEGVGDLKEQLGLMQRRVVEGEMAGAQLELVTKEKERLETELRGVREQLGLLDREKATSEQRWKDQVDATKSRMDELQGFLQEAEVQVRELGQAMEMNKQLTQQVAELKSQLAEKEREVEEAQERATREATARERAAEEEAKRARAAAEEVSRKLAATEGLVEGLRKEVGAAEARVREATGDLEKAQELAREGEAALRRLSEGKEEVERELGARKEALARVEAEGKEVQGRLAAVQRELTGVRNEAETERRKLDARLKSSEVTMGELRAEVLLTKERLSARTEEAERVTAELSALQKEREKLAGEVKRLAAAAEERAAAVAEGERARKELEGKLREAQREVQTMDGERRRIKERQAQMTALEKTVEGMKQDTLRLQKELKEKEEEAGKARGEAAEQERARAAAAAEVEALQLAVKGKESEVGKAQGELSALQAQMRTVKKALEVAVREAEEAKAAGKKDRQGLLDQQKVLREKMVGLERQLARGEIKQEDSLKQLEKAQGEAAGKEAELKKAQAALAERERQGEAAAKEMAALRASLEKKEQALGAAVREKGEVLVQVKALKATLGKEEAKAEALREQQEEARRKAVEALHKTVADLTAKLKAAEGEAKASKGALEEARKELAAKQEALGAAEKALELTEGRGKQLVLRLETEKSKASQEGVALREGKREQQRLQAQLASLKKALKAQEEASRKEVAALEEAQKGQAEALEAEAARLRERLEGSERAAKKQREEVDAALRQLRQREGEVAEAQAALARQRDAGGRLVEEVGGLGAAAAEKEAALRRAEADRARLEEQVAALTAAAAERKVSEAKAREEFEARSKRTISELQLELAALKQLSKEKEAGLEASRVAAMRSASEEGEKKVGEVAGRLGKENLELKRELEGLQEKLRAQMREREEREAAEREREATLRKENEALSGKVKALEAQAAALEDSVEAAGEVEGEVGRLQALVAEAEKLQEASLLVAGENQELQREVVALRQGLARVEEESLAQLSAAKAEGERAKAQVEVLKRELLDTDELMKSQLEAYQAELLNLQATEAEVEVIPPGAPIPGVFRTERGGGLATAGMPRGMVLPGLEDREQVPAGALPWDFWSSLLLKVDELLLTKKVEDTEAAALRKLVWHRDAGLCEFWTEVQAGGAAVDNRILAEGLRGLIGDEPVGRQILHVVHIAAEMAPVAKVGGLGDVVTGLCRSLQQRGHLVEVILPKYDCMDYSRIDDLQMVDMDFKSYFDGQMHSNRVWRGTVEGLPVHFIEPHHPGRFFWRGTFYGCADDFKRFTYFCRAALDFLQLTAKRPDIIHCHDWQTAAVAPLYWDVFVPKGMSSAQVVLTCHNFEYQGTEHNSSLAWCGLDVARQLTAQRMQDNFLHDKVNLLKGGIVYSNIVTTVSPTYAAEVRGPEGGRGLHLTLAQHASKFFGVLNGIDTDVWDPQTDELIHVQYGAREAVEGKQRNKDRIKSILRLSSNGADANKPLVGCVTRLVPQKGVHLIRHAIFRTKERGGQFVLLGSSPVPDIQRDFENLARQTENDPDVRLVLKYDEGLSHLIFASCDMIIIPSIFEPCGLTQLIAMRYGAIPVVRKTGGLADSVFDVDDPSVPAHKRNGYAFTATDAQGLNYALDRALGSFYERPQWWAELVERTMEMDFSWSESCNHYVSLYQKALASKNL